MKRPTFAFAAALGLLTACNSADLLVSPDPVVPSLAQSPESGLGFLNNAPGAPSFATTSVSFWAVKGKDRQASIYFRKRPGLTDSSEFVRFRVTKRSLVNRPNGTPIAAGDSILITITIADSARRIVSFAPAGLVFDSKRQAKLWIWSAESDPDVNHDGSVNSTDTNLLQSARIWRQEQVGLPWNSQATVVNLVTHQYTTEVGGFTRYAVAY